jgi:hypothetical protein
MALRFIAGFAGSVLVGFLAFRWPVFEIGQPASQCVIVGALVAGAFTLFRVGRPVQAVALVCAFAVVQLPLNIEHGLARCLATFGWSLFLGLGICVVAAVFDRLGRLGFVFFKFLVAGPLLGGIYLAASPLLGLATGQPESVTTVMWLNSLIGIVIGDGAGFGIELVELVPAVRVPTVAGAAVDELGELRADTSDGDSA